MQAEIYWICEVGDGRLAIMPRPRGGDWLQDEIRSLREVGVDVVVSLLERQEITELDIAAEEALCQASEISFMSFPITDRSVPASKEAALAFADSIFNWLRGGKNVAIHCRAGIGRSSLIAACVLMKSGVGVDEALQRIERARGCSVPDTPEQREWVAELSAI
jgi:protein-tyrosine phosphatase